LLALRLHNLTDTAQTGNAVRGSRAPNKASSYDRNQLRQCLNTEFSSVSTNVAKTRNVFVRTNRVLISIVVALRRAISLSFLG
jgi:hypothetical protein